MDIDKLISTIKQQTLLLNVYLVNQKQSLDKYGVQFRQLVLLNTKEHLNKMLDSLEKTQPRYKIPFYIRPTNELINSPITRQLDCKIKISDKLVNTNLNAFILTKDKSNSSIELPLHKYDSNYKIEKLVKIESKNNEADEDIEEEDSKYKKEIAFLDDKLKQLETDLRNRNEKIEKLSDELASLKTESELADQKEKSHLLSINLEDELNQTRMNSLANKNTQLEEELYEKKGELDKLINELDQEKTLCSNARTQAKCLEERLVQMDAQFELLNRNTSSLNEELQKRIEYETQFEKELMKVNEESNREKSELVTKLKCLEEKQIRHEEQIESLRSLNEQLQNELDNLLNLKKQEEKEEDFNSKHNELESLLEKKDQQIMSLKSELEKEKQKTNELDNRINDLQIELSRSFVMSDSVSNVSDITVLETALEQAKTQLETLTQKNAELEMLNKKKETQIKDLTRNLDQLGSSIELGKRNYTNLNLLNENELMKETSSSLDTETIARTNTDLMSELILKNEIYEKSTNEFETRIKELNYDLDETRRNHCLREKSLEVRLDENARVIQRLEVQIGEKDALICQLKTKQDSLVSELREAHTSSQNSNNLENLLSEKEAKLEELARENEKLLISLEENKQRARTSEHKLTNLEFKLKQSESLLDQKEEEIKEINNELAKMEKVLNEKELEIKKITTALVRTNEARVPISLDYKWKEIDQLLDKKEAEFKSLELRLNESEAERVRQENEIDRLTKELDDKVRLNEINSDLLKLSKQEADLNAMSKIDLEKAKITCEEENAQLRSELNALRFELDKLRVNDPEELVKKCKSLESEIQSKDAQIKTLREKLEDIKLVNEQLTDLQRSLKEQEVMQADREEKLKRKVSAEKEKLVRDLKEASETWLKERAELSIRLEQMNWKYKELSDTYVKIGFEKTLLQGDNSKLKEQLSKSESQLNVAKNEMKEFRDKLSEKPAAGAQTSSKLVSLRLSELDHKDHKYTKLENLLKQKQEEIDSVTRKYDEEHIELGRVNRRAQVLQHDLAEAESELTKEKANRNKLDRQKTDLQRKLEEMDRQLEVSANTQAMLNDSRMRADAEVTKLKNEIEELNRKHEASYAQLRTVHEETVREMNERISQLIRAVNKLEREKSGFGVVSEYSTAASSSSSSPTRVIPPPHVFSSSRVYSPSRRFF